MRFEQFRHDADTKKGTRIATNPFFPVYLEILRDISYVLILI